MNHGSEGVCGLTLLAGFGLWFLDGEVQWRVLVCHEKLAEDGILCGGSGAGTGCGGVRLQRGRFRQALVLGAVGLGLGLGYVLS